ncbi:MAG: DUF6268 family outer membrane beta-barrel protein [Bacteroidota bacterium]
MVKSQHRKLAGSSFTRFPVADLNDSPLNQQVKLNEYNFFLNLPKPLKNQKTLLIHGFSYTLVTPFTDNDLNLGLDGQKLHLIGYRLTAMHQLKKNWRALVSLNSTLSSTFNTALEGDDFLFNGLLQFTKKKSDRFSYGAGVTFTSRFGEPILIPTLQLTFDKGDSKLQVLLPRSITYDCYFGKLTTGIQIAASGSLYNINSTRTNILNEIEPVDKLAYTRVVVGPSFRYRVGKMVEIEVSGGITLARRVELQGDVFDDQNTVANGPFFEFGLAIVPPRKKTN